MLKCRRSMPKKQCHVYDDLHILTTVNCNSCNARMFDDISALTSCAAERDTAFLLL